MQIRVSGLTDGLTHGLFLDEDNYPVKGVKNLTFNSLEQFEGFINTLQYMYEFTKGAYSRHEEANQENKFNNPLEGVNLDA